MSDDNITTQLRIDVERLTVGLDALQSLTKAFTARDDKYAVRIEKVTQELALLRSSMDSLVERVSGLESSVINGGQTSLITQTAMHSRDLQELKSQIDTGITSINDKLQTSSRNKMIIISAAVGGLFSIITTLINLLKDKV